MSWRQDTGHMPCAPADGESRCTELHQSVKRRPALRSAAVMGFLAGAALFGAIAIAPPTAADIPSQPFDPTSSATNPDDGTAACLAAWIEYWDCQELGREDCDEPDCEI